MNKNINNILRFILLLFLQVTILNRVNFGSFINPQIYIIYVILFPYYNINKGYFLLSSFFLGISIDFFMNSGGINAFALTLIAYFRQSIFNIFMGQQDVKNQISIRDLPVAKSINYIFFLTFIHHTALFWLENFSFDELMNMFFGIFVSSIYTTVIIVLSLSLLLKKSN